MKLAHYYKVSQRDIVRMMYEFNSEPFTSVIIHKDYEDYIYPDYIMSDSKASYRGLAISNGRYIPMDLEIENRPADTSIYEGMLKHYKRTSEAKQIFRNLMAACHLRISLNEKDINNQWKTQLLNADGKVRHVIIHDKNVTDIKDAYIFIKDLATHYGKKNVRLGFKFPVIMRSSQEVLEWGQLPKSMSISNLYLYDIINDDILEHISLSKQQLTYVINNRYWTLSKFLNELPHIFLQGMFLSRYAIPLLLKIDNDFLVEEEWQQVVGFFNAYMKSCVLYRNQLVFSGYTYCKYSYLPLQNHEKIHLFKFIKDRQPNFFDLLYNTEYVNFENNQFVPHMYTWGEIEAGGGYGGYYYKQGQERKREQLLSQYNYADLILPEYLYLE